MLQKKRTDALTACSQVCIAALAAGCLISSCLAAPAVVKADGGLRLRQQPSTGSAVITTLADSTKLDVLNAVDDDWYHVAVGSRSGYVSRDYVSFTCTGKVNTASLNLRSGPGTSYSKLASLSKGATVVVLAMEKEWYQVSSGGKTGYVSMDYLTLDSTAGQTQPSPSAQTSQQSGTVNASSLNIRSGPGTGFSKVTSLPKGTAVTILSKEGDWYKLKAAGKTGYASQQYITLSDAAQQPADTAPAPAPLPSVDADPSDTSPGTVNASSLNVRSGPGSSHPRVGTLSNGAAVTIVGEENGWYHINFNAGSGYVFKQYITLSQPPQQQEQEQEQEQPPQQQEQPPQQQEQPPQQQEQPPQQQEQPPQQQEQISQEPAQPIYGIVSTGSLNIRSGPSSSHEKLGSLSSGEQVELLETLDGWYRISQGYVSASYITVIDGSTTALRAQIVAYAKQFLGYPYVLGGKGPNTFDCSGLMWYVYDHFGYTINRSATQQLKNGVTITKDALQPGDLVFFNSAGTGVNKATHVGMYIGDGQFLHASSSKVGVVISDLYSTYYKKVYTTSRRIL